MFKLKGRKEKVDPFSPCSASPISGLIILSVSWGQGPEEGLKAP